ncbi:Cytochrome P450 [Penicillium antarcticum]|uniref:Cytochrome P450 n=1 Tax=Penicillium antarcticum TaxID=416450 RepID=UPI00239452E3|nr:Cytochrome P450 [Penicillium antarcticum]KAJ5293714.1 Cytochrome P450 [Penicillium antarcticum]
MMLATVVYFYERLNYHRIKQFKDWPQLKPSLLLGRLKSLNDVIMTSKPNVHIGTPHPPGTSKRQLWLYWEIYKSSLTPHALAAMKSEFETPLGIIQWDTTIYGLSAEKFRPKRWLRDSTEPSNPIPASAIRAFERGSRNCIGQELAESKSAAVLVCVVRRYTWEKVGLGSFEFDGDSPVLGDDGRFRVGEGAYKVLQITANPIDGMKMRVRRTE